MILFKYLLHWGGITMIVAALAILARDLYLFYQATRKKETEPGTATPPTAGPLVRWRGALALGVSSVIPILLASGIVVVPSATGGVRISQSSGTLPGTLYPGEHFLTPLVESVVLFDTRDQIFTTGAVEDGRGAAKPVPSEPLRVQAKEGLIVGLAITVRLPAGCEAPRLHSGESAAAD